MALNTSKIKRHQSHRERLPSSKDEDPDAATNEMLFREQKTWSKGRIQRMRIMSVFVGNVQPSRKKVFTTIQVEGDCQLYNVTVHNKIIPCAKVFNPAILEKNSKIWPKLSQVQRFELEDPEGILTVVPKHYATNMERLESFSITWTRVKSLPNELFREGLKTLSLPRNQLKTLNGIEKAVDLSNLDVSSNMLTELPKTFGHLYNLTTLNISGNSVKELPENFGALSQLRVFDCSCNRLSTLPDSINNLIELTCLDVSNNSLTALPETIADLPRLEDLRARANQLQYLPHRFGQLIRLSSLTLRKNNFTDVPIQLSSISSLQSLNMRNNSIKSFPCAVPSLKTLILDSNALEEMQDELFRCSNLQMLSLEDNKITSIPVNIKNMRSLRVLHLSGNDIAEVPEDIGHLEHLRHLSLRSTQIQKLPNAILTMENLVKLDIDDCPRLEDYLRLAHKDGGLVKVREEMLQENSDTTNFNMNSLPKRDNASVAVQLRCKSTGTAPHDANDVAILSCKRDTILSPDLPGEEIPQRNDITYVKKNSLPSRDNASVVRHLHSESTDSIFPGIAPYEPNGVAVQACRHDTILSSNLPGDLLSPAEEQQQNAQELTATLESKQESNETALCLSTIRESQNQIDGLQISMPGKSNSFNQDQEEVQERNVVKKNGPPTKPKAGRVSEKSGVYNSTERIVVMDSGNLIRERLSKKQDFLMTSKRQSQV